MKRVSRMRSVAVVAGAGVLGAAALAKFALPMFGPDGPRQNDRAVDTAVRSEVVDAVVANLDRAYVFPQKAELVGNVLRAKMQRGEFDGISSAEEFAEVLTDTLQEQTKDKHLEVRYFDAEVPDRPDGEATPEETAIEQLQQQRLNYGFENVGRLRFNVGLIDLHQFGRPLHAAERIAAAMTLLGDTEALVFDLRQCHGGDPETVMLLASYLFDKRTHLNDIYFRDENRTEERWTTDTVPGRRYGETRDIYLLTSNETFSGCEDFAYALKNSGRATIVGATTGGGAHAGSPHRLNAHFMMFVPSGLPISPVTHTDWEGVGVAPDIETSADDALDIAQVAILRKLMAVEADPRRKAQIEERIAELD